MGPRALKKLGCIDVLSPVSERLALLAILSLEVGMREFVAGGFCRRERSLSVDIGGGAPTWPLLVKLGAELTSFAW